MADIIDDAQHQCEQTLERQLAQSRVAVPKLQADGYCNYCYAELDSQTALFCKAPNNCAKLMPSI